MILLLDIENLIIQAGKIDLGKLDAVDADGPGIIAA